METRKFEILDSQKTELEKKFWVPVFIDNTQEKLYIVTETWETEFVF